MALKIVTASERLSEKRGAKILITGLPGVGKTSLLRTLREGSALFLDIESGDLSVSDLAIDQLKAETWEECRDLACYLGGPDRNKTDDEPYSQAHYDACVEMFGDAGQLDKYDTYFIDSLSRASAWSFAWSGQQPEAFNKYGVKDNRAVYGIHGKEMANLVSQLQRAKEKNIIFVCILDHKKDEDKGEYWAFQMDGQKAAEVIPGIVDITMTLAILEFDDGPARCLITDIGNEWGYPAKDRSGRLQPLEPPDLGDIIERITQGPTTEEMPQEEKPTKARRSKASDN